MVADADLLDLVRKMRQYMTTLDGCHMALDIAAGIEELAIKKDATAMQSEVVAVAKKTSELLKKIESTKQYRDMLRKYNMSDTNEEEDD